MSPIDAPERQARAVVFGFHFSRPPGEVAFCVSFQYHILTWGRGGGETGNYSNISRCFGNNREHISTVTSAMTCCWPGDTFKRKRCRSFSLKQQTPRQFFVCYYSYLSSTSYYYVQRTCRIVSSQPYIYHKLLLPSLSHRHTFPESLGEAV